MLDPEIESLDWSEQAGRDDDAYRRQIARLFDRSRFYRDRLVRAGFRSAADVGGLDAIAALPFTEKDDLRASRSEAEPIGTHLACERAEIARIYSTSGTTGTPSFIPLTRTDIDNWVRISARSYAASGLSAGERVVTSYNAGPFVAGAALASFDRIGACHIPVGTGNTDRLLTAIRLLQPDAVVATPSYGLYLAEKARERGIDLPFSSVRRLIVAGEPGGGEPLFRARLEEAWGARVTEAMGIGDIAVSLWGECEHQDGMHFGGRGLVHVELIDPDSGAARTIEDGATGELVYTHLAQEAAPLLRFRSRDRPARDRLRVLAGGFGSDRDPPSRAGGEAGAAAPRGRGTRRRGGRRSRPRRADRGPPARGAGRAGADRPSALRIARPQRIQVEAGRMAGGMRPDRPSRTYAIFHTYHD
jgi:phenylacetate-CoA ligase